MGIRGQYTRKTDTIIAYAPAGKMEAFFAERDKHGGTAYSTDLALYMACDMELLGPPLPLD